LKVLAIGGIGGVHRRSGDVSADLTELSRTLGTVICSGPKSVVDPRATLERLEELGVGVLGYRTDQMPFFLVRSTPVWPWSTGPTTRRSSPRWCPPGSPCVWSPPL
jgi:pseudouridine-5'-phosphate glycosidase